MDCPRCIGLTAEVIEQDEEGEYCECLRCLNCGWRLYAQPVGKQIEVTKGVYYDERSC